MRANFGAETLLDVGSLAEKVAGPRQGAGGCFVLLQRQWENYDMMLKWPTYPGCKESQHLVNQFHLGEVSAQHHRS